ncbi:MAG TPA: hypothetical protein DE117_06770 [Fervidobacterium sp.]|nr:ParB/RepB/Spo0J family partition protein [Pseudomonadota bacterium]HCI29859.1 hypothetical protein [Fervidobacterium sp.]
MSQQPMATFELLPVDNITLDLKNPRIAKWLEIYEGTPTSEQIELALRSGGGQDDVGGPSYQSLKQSIQTNKGIIHPIIVNREIDGKLIVIEGNTRTHIYRELRASDPQGPWDKIPSMVYDRLPLETVDAIRLQAHLVGTREWDPYSKAKYLNFLRNNEHLTFSQLVDFCGGDKREVQNYIEAYNDMEEHYRPILDSDQDFDPSRFSAFIELQRPRVTEALLMAGFAKIDFAEWVHTQKLYPLATVRKLPQIMQNERAKTIFLKSGAQEAIKVLDIPTPASALQDAPLEQLARELCKRISTIQYSDLQKLRSLKETPDIAVICDAKDALNDLCQDIGFDME